MIVVRSVVAIMDDRKVRAALEAMNLDMDIYGASKRDCDACALKPRCCPNTPARKIPRDLEEDARDVARALAGAPAYERSLHRRKKVEMLFAHLKRFLRPGRLRLRGPCGARDEFLLAAPAQNLRKLATLRPMTALA